MPPQNQPNENIEGSQSESKEKQGANQPEAQPVLKPETAPEPVSKEKPASETFSDQQTVAPGQPAQAPQAQPEPPQNQSPLSLKPIDADKEVEKTIEPTDKAWVLAVDNVIEKDESKPFEEEEDSEDLQIKYLKKKYGKDLKKSKDT